MPGNLNFLSKNPARANEMRENGILTDVTLVISEHEIKAHKIILALASDYFNSMFASGNSFLHIPTCLRKMLSKTIELLCSNYVIVHRTHV